MNRTRVLLLILAVVALVFVWQQLGTDDPPPRERSAAVSERGASAGSRAALRRRAARTARTEGPVRRIEELRLAELEAESGASRVGRNPFDFFTPPPPKPTGPTPEELAAQRAAAEAARLAALKRQQEEADRPPPKPKPPAITFTYLGYFGPENRRIAVLADGDTLMNVLVGDVVKDKFRLVEIGFESVAFEFIDFPDEPAAKLRVGA